MDTKTIFTSNYNRRGSDPNAASVSVGSPDYFDGPHITSLAPTWDMVMDYKNGKLTQEEYAKQYIHLLETVRKLTPTAVYNVIPDGTILLCYEKPGDFCHRRLLAEWMEDALNVTIPEWNSEEELQKSQLVDSLLDF